MPLAAKNCMVAAGFWCGIGLQLPIAPTAIALFAVMIVRVLSWEGKRSFIWNMAVALLAMLGTLVTVEGHEISGFKAFWIGVGYGGMGVGIVKVGTEAFGGVIKERITGALKTLFGIKDTPA